MASDCVGWVAQVGVASVREYEETRIRKARERETLLLELQQQELRLAARLTFEERKALGTGAKKLHDSMAKDEKELSALEHKLRPAHEKSDKLKEVRAAEEFCGVRLSAMPLTTLTVLLFLSEQDAAKAEEEAKKAREVRAAAEAALKNAKRDLKAVADQTAAARAKEAAARESLEERRGQRQRAFARALLASELMASEPFEASALVGTGTLNGEPEVADEGAQGIGERRSGLREGRRCGGFEEGSSRLLVPQRA
jgi:hypothetical protein